MGFTTTTAAPRDEPRNASARICSQDGPDCSIRGGQLLAHYGEGSRSAGRRYDAGAERAAANPKRVEERGKKAEKALEGAEGNASRDAEERGKKGAHR
jgi:hypothetical protein